MSSNPNEPGRISVTLKGEGRDATWIVFHGSPGEVRAQVMEVFDLPDESSKQSLADLINEATSLYRATGNVSNRLGGRTLGGGASAWDRTSNGNGGSTPQPEVDPNKVRVEAAIDAAATRDELKELYARNEAVFSAHADLLVAYKAKGKSLPS